MLGFAAISVIAGAWLFNNKNNNNKALKKKALGTKDTWKDRLFMSRNPERMFDFQPKLIGARKMLASAPPFSGQAKNTNPRVPTPFFMPVPKQAPRVDWRSQTASSMFKRPAYKESYKRIHQMVYGTPTVEARRGLLQVDWGHSDMKGYPIHQGRVQSWLGYGERYEPEGLVNDLNTKTLHFDLGKVLKNRLSSNTVNLDEKYEPSAHKVKF